MLRWLGIVALAACVHSESAVCPSGRVCPVDTVCVLVATVETCTTDDQRERCTGKLELEGCDDADDRKRCIDGVCLDACGNQHVDPGEVCDDGNTIDGDGCSSRCVDERCGNGVIDLVLGEECDDGRALVSGDGCSSTCRLEQGAWTNISRTPIDARAGVALAYDSNRNQLVAFGGTGPDGLFGDTWAWGQYSGQWTQQLPPRSPPARHQHSMAFDSDRGRIVMFGGYGANGVLADTWEWDGTSWVERVPAHSPPARFQTQIAYDASRKKTVLFGGNRVDPPVLTDTWEWDGTDWTERTPATHPTGAFEVQLGYDAGRDQLIYCGTNGTNQTWKWDGTTWTDLAVACPQGPLLTNRLTYAGTKLVLVVGGASNVQEWNGTTWSQATVTGLPARRYPGVGYDGLRVVVLGGHISGDLADATEYLADTWVRAGAVASWTNQPTLIPSPTAREQAAMVFDPVRGRALLFGGRTKNVNSDELWELGRLGWTKRTSGPSARSGAAMVFEVARDQLIVFGGNDAVGARADTWRYNGVSWAQLSPSTAPSARAGARLVYDSVGDRSILFGGYRGGWYGDTWIWDGTAWTDVTPASSPPPRSNHAMAYDPIRDRVVLFGGTTDVFSLGGDTWEWDGTSWTEMVTPVAPAARTGATLTYDPLRRVMVLIGGGTDIDDHVTFDDRWEWDGVTWTRVGADSPLPRSRHHAYFDPMRGGLVTFGGSRGYFAGLTDETWILRYTSLAPRETCILADDDLDGDGLAGCTDPDCWGRCTPACLPGTSCMAGPTCGDNACSAVEDYLLCPADCPAP